MLDTPTAIITGFTVLGSIWGIVAVLTRIFPGKKNNPGNSVIEKRLNGMEKKFERVRYKDNCSEIVKRLDSTFEMLEKSVNAGFKNMDKQLDAIRKGLN